MRKYGESIWILQLLLVSEGKTEQEASDMVKELITEINSVDGTCVPEYGNGNNQPLIDCINSSNLTWFDSNKKLSLISDLN
jgi:hypothetical protein